MVQHRNGAHPQDPEGERIQKVLAGWGYGSRREVEELIRSGRVQLDGERAELGWRMGAHNVVRVDSKVVRAPARSQRRLLLYHKPPGEICSRRDEHGRPSVFEALPAIAGGRWVQVGRLDYNTSGLLLFTNDGDWAQQLMRARVEREYLVRVSGTPRDGALRRLCTGVPLAEGRARFTGLWEIGGRGVNRWFRVAIEVGWTRVVRRLWESEGLQISRLKRLRYASLQLPPELPPGRVIELAPEILEAVPRSGALPPPPRRKRTPRRIESVNKGEL